MASFTTLARGVGRLVKARKFKFAATALRSAAKSGTKTVKAKALTTGMRALASPRGQRATALFYRAKGSKAGTAIASAIKRRPKYTGRILAGYGAYRFGKRRQKRRMMSGIRRYQYR